MKFIKGVLSIYRPSFARTIVYMLQATEYDVSDYLGWLWRVFDFGEVMRRRSLVKTRPARMLLAVMQIGMLAQVIAGANRVLYYWLTNPSWLGVLLSLLFILSTPVVWAHLIVVPLAIGRWFISKPAQTVKVRASKKIFRNHSAIKIAVAGSYGKTTVKEILATVLAEGKKVAATPANRNVVISHAQFAAALAGDEDVLIIEYGEGAPGDVAKFAKITKPDIGIITGVAPAHIDKYKTVQAAGEDIFSLANYVDHTKMFVNNESPEAKPFIKKDFQVYDSAGVDKWRTSDLKNSLEGLNFKLTNGNKTVVVKSKLVGLHLVGPLSLAIFLADQLGLSVQQIEKGIAGIKPFEHRMQVYNLHGAYIVDDTYNGNIEGMKAGLKLLKEQSAKRKIYVTPGLVDQGKEEERVHHELGQAIKDASPDILILMNHSVTEEILKGLDGYKGKLVIEEDPLNFYTNLDKFVAAGDLVVMQNDWPDNYN